MKSGYELLKESITEKYEGESFWDYAWLLLVPVAVVAWSILALII